MEEGITKKSETVSIIVPQLTGHVRLWVLGSPSSVGLSVHGWGGMVHGRHERVRAAGGQTVMGI